MPGTAQRPAQVTALRTRLQPINSIPKMGECSLTVLAYWRAGLKIHQGIAKQATGLAQREKIIPTQAHKRGAQHPRPRHAVGLVPQGAEQTHKIHDRGGSGQAINILTRKGYSSRF